MDPYIVFLRDGQLPEDLELGPIIAKKAKWFEWYDGALHKKSYTHPLLKCVTPTEGNYILREIHEGACGTDQGIQTLMGRLQEAGTISLVSRPTSKNWLRLVKSVSSVGKCLAGPPITSLRFWPFYLSTGGESTFRVPSP